MNVLEVGFEDGVAFEVFGVGWVGFAVGFEEFFEFWEDYCVRKDGWSGVRSGEDGDDG